MLRNYASLFVLLGAFLLIIPAAFAADVEVRLTGGTVTGKARGQGTATVEAQVVNRGASALKGVRLGVCYSTVDAQPGPGANWREHEFIFEPPLPPGEATSLSFTDENAAEYVALEVRYALFEDGGQTGGNSSSAGSAPPAGDNGQDTGGEPVPPDTKPAETKPDPKPEPKPEPARVDPDAVSSATVLYRGMPINAASPLVEKNGVVYVSTRDLMDNTGGDLSYDGETYEVILERKGHTLAVKTGQRKATADGADVQLAHSVLDIDGRSYLPLIDCAQYLGFSASANDQTITLEEAE